jgi:hypothetical protein
MYNLVTGLSICRLPGGLPTHNVGLSARLKLHYIYLRADHTDHTACNGMVAGDPCMWRPNKGLYGWVGAWGPMPGCCLLGASHLNQYTLVFLEIYNLTEPLVKAAVKSYATPAKITAQAS